MTGLANDFAKGEVKREDLFEAMEKRVQDLVSKPSVEPAASSPDGPSSSSMQAPRSEPPVAYVPPALPSMPAPRSEPSVADVHPSSSPMTAPSAEPAAAKEASIPSARLDSETKPDKAKPAVAKPAPRAEPAQAKQGDTKPECKPEFLPTPKGGPSVIRPPCPTAKSSQGAKPGTGKRPAPEPAKHSPSTPKRARQAKPDSPKGPPAMPFESLDDLL